MGGGGGGGGGQNTTSCILKQNDIKDTESQFHLIMT